MYHIETVPGGTALPQVLASMLVRNYIDFMAHEEHGVWSFTVSSECANKLQLLITYAVEEIG